MKSGVMLVAALAASTMLAGCETHSRDHFIVGSTPDDYRTRHPIIVSESEVTEDIPISSNMKELSFRDNNLVNDVASRFLRSGGKYMQVLVPTQSTNEAAASRLSKEVVAALVKRGVKRHQISVSSYHAGSHSRSAPIRMSFAALAANVDDCGKWDKNIIAGDSNRQYGNFACATQNNLAKMIANPADLVGPRGSSPIDASRRDNVISDWRESGSGTLAQQF